MFGGVGCSSPPLENLNLEQRFSPSYSLVAKPRQQLDFSYVETLDYCFGAIMAFGHQPQSHTVNAVPAQMDKTRHTEGKIL